MIYNLCLKTPRTQEGQWRCEFSYLKDDYFHESMVVGMTASHAVIEAITVINRIKQECLNESLRPSRQISHSQPSD